MIKIIVEYRDKSSGQTLGLEQFDDIEQTLVPRLTTTNPNVFCIRHFSGHQSERWRVASVRCVSAQNVLPVSVVVDLSPVVAEGLEYLDQTLNRRTGTVFQLIKPGALVEVDYGFVQNRVDVTGNIGGNHRFLDSHLTGEMHKRRLAIVTKVYHRSLQVAPVTSQTGVANDPTRMRLTPATLSKLSFYGTSGANSWALGSALECVSFSRVLPPTEIVVRNGAQSHVRNPSYRLFISSAEQSSLKEAVLRGVGVDDYANLKSDRTAAEARAQLLLTELAARDDTMKAMEAELGRLRLVERVARDWERTRSGPTLDDDVQFLIDLESDPTLNGTVSTVD